MPFKDYILIPQTCDCVTLHGKGDVTSMIKLRTFSGEIILGYPGGLNVITRVLVTGRQEGQSPRRSYDGQKQTSK